MADRTPAELEAIAAMRKVPFHGRVDAEYLARLLAAIPGDVHVHLAAEKGALLPNGWSKGEWHQTFSTRKAPDDDPAWVRLYRLVDPPQPQMMQSIWPKKVGEDTVALEDVVDPPQPEAGT